MSPVNKSLNSTSLLLILLLFVSPPVSAQFTLEQVMSAPFPTGLVAAPTGGAVAWVFNDQGERNIWVAEPPEYKGRPVTAYKGDDGQEISNLTWTPGRRRDRLRPRRRYESERRVSQSSQRSGRSDSRGLDRLFRWRGTAQDRGRKLSGNFSKTRPRRFRETRADLVDAPYTR